MNERNIVFKVEDDMNPSEIYCTTYQMRNFYTQFSDGFFSSLDVMNYIQHHAAVTRMKKNWKILDVCCGRGLLLPLIRYYKKDIKEYIGVDICENNIKEQLRKSGNKKIDNFEEYYPFKITHHLVSVEDMETVIVNNSIDFIVYTSAIEHMQKEVGYKSLQNCFILLKPGNQMFLSCPNTKNKKNKYDTQYAAHIYEWEINELKEALFEIGFEVSEEYGLVSKVKELENWVEHQKNSIKNRYYKLKKYLPSQWLMSYFSILYPEIASEILLIVKKPNSNFKGLFNE